MSDLDLDAVRARADRYTGATGGNQAYLAHQLAGDVSALVGEVERLEVLLRATAEGLRMPAGFDPNEIPAAAALTNDAAANLREQLDRTNAGRQALADELSDLRVGMIEQIFTFGYGHVCPYTGRSLVDHYATVVAPDKEQCRALMLGMFGNRWAFEYDSVEAATPPGYGPLVEHMRLVVSQPDGEATRAAT